MKTTYVIAVAMGAALLGYGVGSQGKLAWMADAPMSGQEMAGQEATGHHSGHHAAAMPPWAQAYDDANGAMHAGMMIAYTDNPDLDFARSMIAHHEGAVAMAKIQLDHGKDPEIRALAEGVIVAQTAEIAQMQAWVAKQ